MALSPAGGIMPGMFFKSFTTIQKKVIASDIRVAPDMKGFYMAIIDWTNSHWMYMGTHRQAIAEKMMAEIIPLAIAQRDFVAQPTLTGEQMDWGPYKEKIHQVVKVMDEIYSDSDTEKSFKKIMEKYGPPIKGFAQQNPMDDIPKPR